MTSKCKMGAKFKIFFILNIIIKCNGYSNRANSVFGSVNIDLNQDGYNQNPQPLSQNYFSSGHANYYSPPNQHPTKPSLNHLQEPGDNVILVVVEETKYNKAHYNLLRPVYSNYHRETHHLVTIPYRYEYNGYNNGNYHNNRDSTNYNPYYQSGNYEPNQNNPGMEYDTMNRPGNYEQNQNLPEVEHDNNYHGYDNHYQVDVNINNQGIPDYGNGYDQNNGAPYPPIASETTTATPVTTEYTMKITTIKPDYTSSVPGDDSGYIPVYTGDEMFIAGAPKNENQTELKTDTNSNVNDEEEFKIDVRIDN